MHVYCESKQTNIRCDHVRATFELCVLVWAENLLYTSAPLTHYTIHMWRVFSAWLINFLQTSGEQRTRGAWKGYPGHSVFFVVAQKMDKFQFAVNGMQTVCGWHSAGSQSCLHIRAFGLRMVCEPFGMLVYMRLKKAKETRKRVIFKISLFKRCTMHMVKCFDSRYTVLYIVTTLSSAKFLVVAFQRVLWLDHVEIFEIF